MNNEEEILKECNLLFVTMANVHIDGKPMADLLKLYEQTKEELEQEKEKYKELEEENKNYKIINETLNNICNSLEKSKKFLNNEFETINKQVKELQIDMGDESNVKD